MKSVFFSIFLETKLSHKFTVSIVKTILFTEVALIAFAANSILCRLALGIRLIDASGFAGVRLLSGAVVLFLIILRAIKIKLE